MKTLVVRLFLLFYVASYGGRASKHNSNNGICRNLYSRIFSSPIMVQLFFFLSAFSLSAHVCPAQSWSGSAPSTYIVSPNTTTGPQPFVTGTADTEQVNYSTGNVSISVPLVQLPGINGPGYSLSVNYNSKAWDMQSTYNPNGGESGSTGPSGTWTLAWGDPNYESKTDFAGGILSIPRLSYTNSFTGLAHNCTGDGGGALSGGSGGGSLIATYAKTNWAYQDEDGVEHPFVVARDLSPNPNTVCLTPMPIVQIDESDSIDGSQYTLNTENTADITVATPNGRVVHFQNIPTIGLPIGQQEATSSFFPTYEVDANGNTTTYTKNPGGTGLVVTDPFGRQVTIGAGLISYGNPSSPTTITATAVPSTGQDVTLHATGCREYGWNPDFPTETQDMGNGGSTNTIQINTGQGTRVWKVVLDVIDEPVQVNYPSGGYTQYSYSSYNHGYGLETDPAYCVNYDVREVTEKSVCRSNTGSCSQTENTLYAPVLPLSTPYNTSETITYPSDARGVNASEQISFGNAQLSTTATWITQPTVVTTSDVISDVTGPLKTVTSSYSFTCFPVLLSNTTTLNASPTSPSSQTINTPGTISESYHVMGASSYSQTCPSNRPVLVQNSGYGGTLVNSKATQWDQTDSFVAADHIFTRVKSQTATDSVLGKTWTELFSYDGNGNMLTSSVSGTNVGTLMTSYTPNSHGQITNITDPRGEPTAYGYSSPYSDSTCSVNSSYSPGPTAVTNALGHIASMQYFSCTGLLQSSVDQNKNSTTYTYDLIGRPETVSYPDKGQTTVISEDTAPLMDTSIIKENLAGGVISTTHTLDGIGESIQSNLDSGVSIVDTTYDALGRVTSQSNPHGATGSGTDGTTTYYYDALGRKIIQVEQDGTSQQWCYNDTKVFSQQSNCNAEAGSVKTGNWVDYMDENGNRSQRSYDAFGNLVKVMEPNASDSLSLETDYQYDGFRNLTSVTQWGGTNGSSGARTRNFAYDGLSRLLSAANPETGTVTYSYLSSGAVCAGDTSSPCSKIDARGVTTNYTYDALNRLTQKSYSDGVTPTSLFVYDTGSISFSATQKYTTSNVIGRLSVICVEIPGNCQSMTAYSYDPMGRIIETLSDTPNNLTTGDIYAVSAAYDLAGDRTSLTNSTGRLFNYSYDAAGRLQTASNTVSLNVTPVTTPMVNSMTYFPSGQPQTMTTDTGSATITGTWGVDKRLRVTSYQNLSTANSADTNYGYSITYTPNSNVLTDAETVYNPASGAISWSWNFAYDSLNRLTSAQSAGAIQLGCAWTYDSFGNRLDQQPSGTGLSCTTASAPVNPNNQLSNPIYSYDAAGDNLTEGGNTLTYDAEGRISAVNGGTTYTYGADGERVSKTSAGVETDFIRDFDGTLLDTYVSGSYINQPQEMWIAGRHYGTWYVSVNNGVQEQGEGLSLTNWLGSEAMRSFSVSNGSNTGVPSYAFLSLPFGDGQTTILGSDNDDIHFTGKERDTESGLDYFGARYYGSSMGRFMSPDWAAQAEPVPYAKLDNPQSLNLYSYVGNNPLSNSDTDGHACISNVNSSSGFCTRADTYAAFDHQLHNQTRFFAAASAATQELADVAVPGLGMAGTSASTRAFLESTGETLLGANQQAVLQIDTGMMTGSGPELDAKLVNMEQTVVQQSLNNLQSQNPDAYNTAITELNGLLNGKSSMAANALSAVGSTVLSTDAAYGQVLQGVRTSLGHDINFANQGDREAIGNALVQHVRQTGGCDVAGTKAEGCQ